MKAELESRWAYVLKNYKTLSWRPGEKTGVKALGLEANGTDWIPKAEWSPTEHRWEQPSSSGWAPEPHFVWPITCPPSEKDTYFHGVTPALWIKYLQILVHLSFTILEITLGGKINANSYHINDFKRMILLNSIDTTSKVEFKDRKVLLHGIYQEGTDYIPLEKPKPRD